MAPKDDASVQAEISRAKYDVEMQSGVVSAVGSSQTTDLLKPTTFNCAAQTDEVLQVDVIAPVQSVRSSLRKIDRAVDVFMLGDLFDVEVQAGVVTSSVATEGDMFMTPTSVVDRTLKSHVSVELFDVELQSGVLTLTSSTQVDEDLAPVRHTVISNLESAPLPGINKKLQVALVPMTRDVSMQSVVALSPDVHHPVRQMPLVYPRYETGVQANLHGVMYDVEAECGVVCFSASSQTDLSLVVVPAELFPRDGAVGARSVPAQFDVELQSGVICDSRASQVDSDLTVGVADSVSRQSGPSLVSGVVHKKMQVSLTPSVQHMALQTDAIITQVDVVSPIQPLGDDMSKCPFCKQTMRVDPLFDVAVQCGAVMSVDAAQTACDLLPTYRIEDSLSTSSVTGTKYVMESRVLPVDRPSIRDTTVFTPCVVDASSHSLFDTPSRSIASKHTHDRTLQVDMYSAASATEPSDLLHTPQTAITRRFDVFTQCYDLPVDMDLSVSADPTSGIQLATQPIAKSLSDATTQTMVRVPSDGMRQSAVVDTFTSAIRYDAETQIATLMSSNCTQTTDSAYASLVVPPKNQVIPNSSNRTVQTEAATSRCDTYVQSSIVTDSTGCQTSDQWTDPVSRELRVPTTHTVPGIAKYDAEVQIGVLAVTNAVQTTLTDDQLLGRTAYDRAIRPSDVGRQHVPTQMTPDTANLGTQADVGDVVEALPSEHYQHPVSQRYDASMQVGKATQLCDRQTEIAVRTVQASVQTTKEVSPTDPVTTRYYPPSMVQPTITDRRTVETYAAPITKDTSTQSTQAEILTTMASFEDPVRETEEAARTVIHHSHMKIPIHSTMARLLIDNNTSHVHTQRNKKCQINLIETDIGKPQQVNKKLQSQMRQEHAACQTDLVPTDHIATLRFAVGASRVDAETEVKPSMLNKKMQVSLIPPVSARATPTPMQKPSQMYATTMTDDTVGLHVWTQCEEVASEDVIGMQAVKTQVSVARVEGEKAVSPIRMSCVMETSRSSAKPEYKDAMTDSTVGTTYVTQILQAEAPTQPDAVIYRTQLVTNCSARIQTEQPLEPTYISHQEYALRPGEQRDQRRSTVDAGCAVSMAPWSVPRSPYVATHLQMDVPHTEVWTQTESLAVPKTTPVHTRHVRIQRGSSWLVSKQQNIGVQVDIAPMDSEIGITLLSPTQTARTNDLVEPGVVRPGSIVSPSGSVRGSVNGGRYVRPNTISWGVQCTPFTVNEITQTIDSSKYDSPRDLSRSPLSDSARERRKSGAVVEMSTQTQTEDNYIIKRVVTTIARQGGSSAYRRDAPVIRQMHMRDRVPLVTSSLPSNLDETFLDDDEDDEVPEERIQTPGTTKRVTTTYVNGTRQIVREELTTELRNRGRSLDSNLGRHVHLGEHGIYETDTFNTREKVEQQTEAEHCFQNLMHIWGPSYLLSRARGHVTGSMSVDRDLATYAGSGPTRLVGARTQYTSTGSLMHTQVDSMHATATTQTSGSYYPLRPPHRNKRIQRGPSYISWSASQTDMPVDVSHSVEGSQQNITRRQSAPQYGYSSTYKETVHEHVDAYEERSGMVEDYVCPKCGTHAHLPRFSTMSTSQSQSLPITQLRNAMIQTKSSGYYTLENDTLTLPTYLSDEEFQRINPGQEVPDEGCESSITWCPAEESEKSGEISTETAIRDEVWVDSQGKLLELQVTGVTVPGTNKTISAAEAFYRGILRLIYWDYTKVGPRQSLTEMSAAVPLVEAIQSNAVTLAEAPEGERAATIPSRRTDVSRDKQLSAHVVWVTPERHRSRYVVHAVRPEPTGTRTIGTNYNVATALREGVIDRQSGQIILRYPALSRTSEEEEPTYLYEVDTQFPYSDQTENISIQEAIHRGILDAELIESLSPLHSQMGEHSRTMPFYSPSDLPHDERV